ncbi:hypothetical protein CLI64_27765 [Nostoc sp. CENA543]|uniref:hypothetical protein n=1 Tax=Nostoc sp. CENA543 TaxID=1869241 RepID=UPI000CA09B67|nr:hypothetical protein [Nostoc sp. CENA543]AUT03884.1 hypothetical protein CLI64_27765 [Nostoc sp. CENA543]
MNALKQNLLPILALTDTQTDQICQVNRDLSMERQHEEKVKQTGSGRKGGREQGEAQKQQVVWLYRRIVSSSSLPTDSRRRVTSGKASVGKGFIIH